MDLAGEMTLAVTRHIWNPFLNRVNSALFYPYTEIQSWLMSRSSETPPPAPPRARRGEKDFRPVSLVFEHAPQPYYTGAISCRKNATGRMILIFLSVNGKDITGGCANASRGQLNGKNSRGIRSCA